MVLIKAVGKDLEFYPMYKSLQAAFHLRGGLIIYVWPNLGVQKQQVMERSKVGFSRGKLFCCGWSTKKKVISCRVYENFVYKERSGILK